MVNARQKACPCERGHVNRQLAYAMCRMRARRHVRQETAAEETVGQARELRKKRETKPCLETSAGLKDHSGHRHFEQRDRAKEYAERSHRPPTLRADR
jgi:hypothetical protein